MFYNVELPDISMRNSYDIYLYSIISSDNIHSYSLQKKVLFSLILKLIIMIPLDSILQLILEK